MNYVTLECLSTILKQNICAFHLPFRKEQDMIGEVHAPFDSKDKAKICALSFKDN